MPRIALCFDFRHSRSKSSAPGERAVLQNKYDDAVFFHKYSQMDRSQKGLEGAGEWHTLQRMLPDFHGKRVLDLGCGFGWHCRYAVERGAACVVGVDLSEKMLNEAARLTASEAVRYLRKPIEEAVFPESTFDIVLSSLALHYVASFAAVCRNVAQCLAPGGDFVFSVEHPVFTAMGGQDWHYAADGSRAHWPVDRYFDNGPRKAVFLGEEVVKYHRTLTTYVGEMLQAGFSLVDVREPEPEAELLESVEGMRDELRRPMMLILAGRKQ